MNFSGTVDFRPKLWSALRHYNTKKLQADLVAGIVVGIVALPLAIAFGIASGVSPTIGLITAIIGGFMVSAFGGNSVQIGGPTGAFIVIVYGIIARFGLEGLAVATFMAGLILVLMGLFKLGTVIKFIPYPIVVGFTAGIALTILSTQVNDFLGMGLRDLPGDFVTKWGVYFRNFDQIHVPTLLVALASLAIIIVSPKISKRLPGALLAIVVITAAVYLLKIYDPSLGITTIGDRFGGMSTDLPPAKQPVQQVKDGSIAFDHVSFQYKHGSGRPVLNDITFSIKPGETLGIIGGTGSAKSSLVQLIPRLYDAETGTVRVGGVDVRDYNLDVLRHEVSMVLQKNVLFSGTILDNLRWGDANASEEECIRMAKLACADEFIERFPDKYNTWIEQGGSNVSGGQKQRLTIARALLRKPKVLILDDSTSAVDTATDAKIRKAFREEIPGTTKIIIAQRISSVQDADRILVLDNGQINGLGTHEELLKTNKIYQEVYNSQTQGGGDFDKQGGAQ